MARVERNWVELLERGIRDGEFPERDPVIMSRSLLGLLVSVWRWYRPGGPQPLESVSEFIVECWVRMVAGEVPDGPDAAAAATDACRKARRNRVGKSN